MYPIGSFSYTFSTLQKRPLLSKFTYGILTQAGPKNLPKCGLKSSKIDVKINIEKYLEFSLTFVV